MVKVKIVNKSNHRLPEYATAEAAGMDLKADILEPMVLKARGSVVVPPNIHIQFPEGCEAQVRGRSGLAFKYDIVSHIGTIDADYRGAIGVKLFNFSDNDFVINDSHVSRYHAKLTYNEDGWLLEDLSSTNGTFVNGNQIVKKYVINLPFLNKQFISLTKEDTISDFFYPTHEFLHIYGFLLNNNKYIL